MAVSKAFENMPIELMYYGTLFALTNRIQTIGDGVFSDITIKQHLVIMTLSQFENNYPTLRDVADVIGCSYQNIKKIALVLEKKGYLNIVRDAEDKRKYRLILTNKVKAVSSGMSEEINNFISTLYQGISHEQLTNALSVLKQMEHNLQQTNS